MSQRPFLTVENNTPYKIKLTYDRGKLQNKSNPSYADKWTWGCTCEGEEFVISATARLNEMFEAKGKDKLLVIGKFRDDENHYPWTCEDFDPAKHGATPEPKGNTPPANVPQPDKQPLSRDDYWTNKAITDAIRDRRIENNIAKSVAIKLASNSMPEIKAWSSAHEHELIKRYHSFLTIVADDLDTALVRVQQATNVHHLTRIWKKHSKLWSEILSPEDYGAVIDECTMIKGRFAEEAEKKKIETEPLPEVIIKEPAGPDVGDGENLLNDLPF